MAFDSTYIDSFASSIRESFGNFDARITTITAFFPADNSIIAFDRIKEYPDFVVRLPGTPKNRRRNHATFYNAFSLAKKINKHTICIKIFRTGMHITGCSSFEECNDMFKIVSEILVVKSNGTPRLQMINIVLDLKLLLDLVVLYSELTKESTTDLKPFTVLYDRERYCGLRMKYNESSGTALVFPSGKVMVSGVKTIETYKAFVPAINKIKTLNPHQ
jgi:TATA-box binding protein (TBP) (component of TFIID and TFIIIB)